jgi:hypothetical protein
MEKKKKKPDLEWLLNSLIEKGWKPRWFGVKKILNLWEWKIIFITNWKGNFSKLRFLTVKESWLWQFVCENKLLAKWILDLPDILWKRDSLDCMRTDLRKSCYPHNYEYRIIESALCDEDKLEEFLLNSIKLD